ncbi:MAG: RagB/SusD family nutrient uptake outer membrane protein [Bacteroidales bacterium]|nr:RagB/SusD family nutrient uptake outer membrane protein [Bacteroidales bacterium]
MRKSIILIAAAALALTSCDSLIDLTPESQLSAESYFKTAEDLQLFTNTFYNNLLPKTPYETESDVFISRNPSNLLRGGNDRTVPDTGGGWTWTNLRKMNTLLANVDNCNDEAAVQTYTALTKFWRAYFYFDKVAKFGDVPWIDHEIGSADADLYNPRDTRETVMQHMIADIDEAIAGLPDKYKAPETAYRVNKYTAMFLKAQFCLFEGTFRKYHSSPAPFADSYKAADGTTHDADWYLQQAADAADQLISSDKYKLYSTGKPAQDYLTLFNQNDANVDEIILAVNYDQALKIKHDCGRLLTNQTASRLGMTKKMVDMYLMKDGSRFTDKAGWNVMTFADEVKDRDPRLAQTIRTPGYSWGTANCGPEFKYCQTGYQSIKYVPAYETKPYSTDNCFNDMPVFRYAEALLIYAEAKAELGTLTQADLDKSVNLIRKRVGMPNLDMAAANAKPDEYLLSPETGYTNVTGANQGVILEIRRERAIELFQEGMGRYFDLMRWAAGYCINQPMYGMYIPGPGDYDLGDNSKYTFFVGVTDSKLEKYQIYEPGGQQLQDMAYLVDPITKEYATSGVWDVMKTISISFDESKHYFYPIPTKELNLNKENLKQNPGW